MARAGSSPDHRAPQDDETRMAIAAATWRQQQQRQHVHANTTKMTHDEMMVI